MKTVMNASKQQEFFRKWADLNHDNGYFALDITSVSSYSELIDFVRWGYNRDGQKIDDNLYGVSATNYGIIPGHILACV